MPIILQIVKLSHIWLAETVILFCLQFTCFWRQYDWEAVESLSSFFLTISHFQLRGAWRGIMIPRFFPRTGYAPTFSTASRQKLDKGSPEIVQSPGVNKRVYPWIGQNKQKMNISGPVDGDTTARNAEIRDVNTNTRWKITRQKES